MASAASSKKPRRKPPRGRPENTSTLSQPAVEDTSTLSSLSSFSPRGDLFAFVSLAVDKHRIRVYDTGTGQSIAQHTVDASRVTAVSWAQFDPSESAPTAVEEEEDAPRRKRKKRASASALQASAHSSVALQVVVLGLSNGTLLIFSPSHGRILRTMSHPSSTSAIVAIDASLDGSSDLTIWTSGADSQVRVWDAQKSDLLSSSKTDDRIPASSLRVRPRVASDETEQIGYLVAHHSIRLLSSSSHPSTLTEVSSPTTLATFTGHASNILSLQWHPVDSNDQSPKHFASMAEADRHIHFWEVPQPAGEGKLLASAPLDSDARSISFYRSNLLALSASGRISVFAPSAEISSSQSSKKTKEKVVSLTPKSSISISVKQSSTTPQIVAASFVEDEGQIRVARLAGGVKPVFDVVKYLDESGNYIADVNIVHKDASAGLTHEDDTMTGAPNKRYAESANLAVRSALELGQDDTAEDAAMRDVDDGALDVDLAELSLGQRLTALDPGAAFTRDDSSDAPSDAEASRPAAASSITLTRTLTQALHSSDTRLLESCLTHTDAALILNTVRRLPPQLAVPLLNACVERLGRGKRAGTGNGRGGGAGSQRATGLLRWIKTVLVIHSAHLMTMPDLVARLSALHATLTTRLTLQESLLSLSGRLDMVLQQIELRTSAPLPSAQPSAAGTEKQKGKVPAASQREPRRYVEGESEDEEEDGMEVEVEEGSEAGSIEDVELGGESGSDDESEEEYDDDEEDSEEDDEGDEGGPRLNGFIDDEAVESDEDGSDEESE
ncbi:NUC189-domain-containing protein [Artomyces pyxidatus]|uniref:NUC189-domain-containing protein n=1 Tax=Artomyces pyxidatus TaxID=48021 RepID=A0ACB8T398_9AGAM|nr:NUC189-domain-containing protein [Artomyces pyxidatus]